MLLSAASEETFTIRRAPWLVRYGLPCLVLLPLMALVAYYWFTRPPTGWAPFMCPPLEMLLLGILISLLRFRPPTVLTIGPEQVALEENDWTITVAYGDVQHLREYYPPTERAYSELVPRAPGGTRLRISSQFDDYERIRALLAAHVPFYAGPGIPAHPAPAVGPARQAVQAAHTLARQARYWKAGLTLAAFAVLLLQFMPLPYLLVMALGLAVPLAAAGALWHYQGILQLSTGKHDPRPTTALALWLPPAAMFGYHLVHFQLVAWQALWWPAAGLALGFWLLLYRAIGPAARARDPLLVAQALLLAAAFGLAAALVGNCAPGYRPPQRYVTQLVRLSTYYSKGTHYNLLTGSWGPAGRGETFRISQWRYEHQREGDTISLRCYPGRLGADWVVLAGAE